MHEAVSAIDACYSALTVLVHSTQCIYGLAMYCMYPGRREVHFVEGRLV